MGVLEQIMQMRNQGRTDQEISRSLQESGVRPNDITNAFEQANIKKAVSNPENKQEQEMFTDVPPSPPSPPRRYSTPQVQELPAPQPKGEQNYEPQMQTQDYYDPQPTDYSSPAGNYDYSEAGYGSDTLIDIAEQVFSEKIKKTEKKIEKLNEFKNMGETRIENLMERVRKLEKIIDQLQIAILKKIGSYGENLNSIKKEMSMMQDSFGKVIPSLAKKHAAHKKKSKTTHHKKTHKKKHKR